MKKISIFTMLLFAPAFSVGAAELSFDEAWNQIYKNSRIVRAVDLEQDAAKTAKLRSTMNWLPKVYIGGSAYKTNDPANVFMGKLKQEQISAADFDPIDLNNPGQHSFYNAYVGVELPLYEGGQKYREYNANNHFYKSTQFNKQYTKNALYADVIQQYGSLIVLKNEREQLEKIKQVLDGVSKHYQLNNSQNPMGKSGALGMDALSNRLNIMMMENAEREKSVRELMSSQGVKNTDWQLDNVSLGELLSQKVKLDLNSESYGLMSGSERAMGMTESAKGAAAAHLPYVSAFAQNETFNGDRGTGNGYTLGVSFKWSLYDPSTQGIQREAELKAAAQQEQIESMREKENAARKSLISALDSANQSVALMQKNYDLLVKQTTETNKLFKNGAINVLQWIDVLSRRLDTSTGLRDAQLNLLQLNAYSINQSKFEI